MPTKRAVKRRRRLRRKEERSVRETHGKIVTRSHPAALLEYDFISIAHFYSVIVEKFSTRVVHVIIRNTVI